MIFESLATRSVRYSEQPQSNSLIWLIANVVFHLLQQSTVLVHASLFNFFCYLARTNQIISYQKIIQYIEEKLLINVYFHGGKVEIVITFSGVNTNKCQKHRLDSFLLCKSFKQPLKMLSHGYADLKTNRILSMVFFMNL